MIFTDDLYCPNCHVNADENGMEELEGHFNYGVAIMKCCTCGALVQDGNWITLREVMNEEN